MNPAQRLVAELVVETQQEMEQAMEQAREQAMEQAMEQEMEPEEMSSRAHQQRGQGCDRTSGWRSAQQTSV